VIIERLPREAGLPWMALLRKIIFG